MFGTNHTGINFNKYEAIPVEATGADCPQHIEQVGMVWWGWCGLAVSGEQKLRGNGKAVDVLRRVLFFGFKKEVDLRVVVDLFSSYIHSY